MPELLRMPEVSAGATTAVLCDWLVRENQPYMARDVLATIETDKAVVDFTANDDGVLLRVLVPAGTEAPVGTPIALIAGAEEKIDDVDAALAALAMMAVPSVSATSPAITPDRTAMPPTSAPTAGTGDHSRAPRGQGRDARVFASPLARRLAHDAGITAETIIGTGPNGRIVRRDVESAIARRQAIASPARPTQLHPGMPAADPELPESVPKITAAPPGRNGRESTAAAQFTETPHSRVRRAIAQRLTVSKQTIPHFYIRGSAQVSDLLELRARLNDSSSVKISVNDFIIKAAARAHELVPDMNVVWTEDSVQKMLSVDLGVAIATPSGLLTPVLRGVERMPISVAAEKCRDLAERAREGRLHQHELEGGTSTVTNLGMYGTEEFAAIINPPQSSILAVGAVRSEPVVTKKGTVRVRPMIRVTLSVDHRPIDGVVAAQWMHSFLEVLEQPLLLLSEGFSRSNAP